MEPVIFDCETLASAGHWSVRACCPSCHADPADDLFSFDLGPPGHEGSRRLLLCCAAGSALPLDALAALMPT